MSTLRAKDTNSPTQTLTALRTTSVELLIVGDATLSLWVNEDRHAKKYAHEDEEYIKNKGENGKEKGVRDCNVQLGGTSTRF